ncbi:MAG: BrnT family toxin [Rhodospirillales bacterium]|nr:BrnT family toxin [Rhodospirillales bacterium]
MIDLAKIEGFDWDEGNRRKSAEKHAVGQGEAEHIFFNDPLLVVEDVRHSIHELRLHALGRTDDGRLLHVTFTLRDNGRLIRVISARAMHRKERVRYEQDS